MSPDFLLAAVSLAIVASTPLLLAVQGELVVQRSGIINLGLEGMLLIASLTAAITAHATGSSVAGIAGGITGAAATALLFGFFTIRHRADQIVTGTAMNLLAAGLTAFIHRELQPWTASHPLPSGRVDLIVPLAWFLFPLLIGILLWSSSTGLRMRASGENPEAVAASGASVPRLRWLALAIQSVLVGFGGAHLALAISSGFAENMTAGRGFIALSIVIFGRWKVKGVLAGTALFGTAAALQYALQASQSGIPHHLLLALPYAITLLILAGLAGRTSAPAGLGK